jgi:hypothetical protein
LIRILLLFLEMSSKCELHRLSHIPAHGSVVVKALCYMLRGLGFETRWGEWFFFFIYLILPAALGPGVYSTSNRNEYQKQKNNDSGQLSAAGAVGLTNLPPSVSGLPRQCGILNISQFCRPPRPVTGIALLFTFYIEYVLPLPPWPESATCRRS